MLLFYIMFKFFIFSKYFKHCSFLSMLSLIITKLGILSEMISVILPLLKFFLYVLMTMLSIRAGLLLPTILAGSVIQGCRKLEHTIYKKSFMYLLYSNLRISWLKSPAMITVFFAICYLN